MLRGCSKIEFEEYADLAYELALDLTRSGYPTYLDGIKTKEFRSTDSGFGLRF